MPRDGSGVASPPPGTDATPNTTILSSAHNTLRADIYSLMNTAWPVALGGTGGTTPQTAIAALLNGTTYVLDANLRIAASGDVTKIVNFDLSGLTTATTRTLTVPDRNGTIALTNDIDTRRNRIVNHDKTVSQENTQTSGTTNGRYISDQNAMYFVSSAGTFTGVNVLTLSPAGGYRDRITITVADASLAAGEYLTYSQNLEGSNVRDLKWGTADAVDAVARIGFKGPAGTYAYRLGNSAANRSYVALFTITGGDANTDVVREFAIPGDTTGTWLNTDGVIGITRDIVLACGSTFQGVAGWQAGNILGTSGVSNGMGTGAAVFEFFDEGFKADPDATGVYGAYEVGGVDAKFRSERYARRRSGRRFLSGPIDSGGNVYVSEQIGFTMCKAPTPVFGTTEAISFGMGWVAAFGPAVPNGDTPSTTDTISYVVAAYASGTPYQSVVAYANWLLLARLS